MIFFPFPWGQSFRFAAGLLPGVPTNRDENKGGVGGSACPERARGAERIVPVRNCFSERRFCPGVRREIRFSPFNNQPDEQNQNLGFRVAGGCGTGLTACCQSSAAFIPRRNRRERAISTSGPRSRRGQHASNKNRSWSWARPAARTALSGPLHSGQKRKRLEDLFPQPPRVARHRMPDPRLHSLIDSFAGRYAPLILLRVSPRLSVSALKTHPHPLVIPKAQPRFPQ